MAPPCQQRLCDVQVVFTVLLCLIASASSVRHENVFESLGNKECWKKDDLTSCTSRVDVNEGLCHWCTKCDITTRANDVTGFADCSDKGSIIFEKYIPTLPDFVQLLSLEGHYIPVIHANTFVNVSHLKLVALDLKSTNLQIIDQGALKEMKYLRCLNIDGNTRLKVESLNEIVSLPNLQELSAVRCNLLMQDVALLRNMRFSNLQNLWLSDNLVDRTIYDRRYVRPHYNFVAVLRQQDYWWFEVFSNITKLDLSESGIDEMHTAKQMQLQALDLSDNVFKNFPATCSFDQHHSLFQRMENLSLARNRITQIGIHWPVCLPNLKYLNLYQNNIYVFADVDKISFMPLVPHLQGLDLGSNEIHFLEYFQVLKATSFLNDSNYIRYLFLDRNNLHGLDEDAFVTLFGHLRKLRVLSLSKVNLGTVTPKMFANFQDTTELILNYNMITFIPEGCFDSLPSLTRLDLSTNAIVTIAESTFSTRLRSQLEIMKLGDNPYSCDCALLFLKQWYVSDMDLFHRYNSEYTVFSAVSNKYYCKDLSGPRQLLADFNIVQQACLLSHETSSRIIFMSVFIITCFTAFTLLFGYRWHLRLLLYEAFRGKGDARRRYLQQGHFDFDVFVSYASEQLPWVRRHLMAQLEDRLGLKLCIHERDFIPGQNIVDNIVDCVESSKKVMMVFTKEFVLSQWCQFELAYCLSHVMEHDDVLIIVCVDDVVSREMTSTMMAVLKTTTYIQWEEGDDAIASFWGRLKIGLHEVLEMGDPRIQQDLDVEDDENVV